MKTINISMTILEFVEVPDSATEDEIREAVLCHVEEIIHPTRVNDLEWYESDNPKNSGTIST